MSVTIMVILTIVGIAAFRCFLVYLIEGPKYKIQSIREEKKLKKPAYLFLKENSSILLRNNINEYKGDKYPSDFYKLEFTERMKIRTHEIDNIYGFRVRFKRTILGSLFGAPYKEGKYIVVLNSRRGYKLDPYPIEIKGHICDLLLNHVDDMCIEFIDELINNKINEFKESQKELWEKLTSKIY